uniref:Immunoglobulin domain-containing protein n=1 Tax=Electrophorus electricus TaxID=8005 RepID=A0AAY5ENB2_ELEEL
TMIAILFTVIVAIPLGNGLKVSQPYYVVGREGKVSLQCTYTKRYLEEIQVSVYKGMYGQARICSALVNLSDPHIETEGRVYCRGNVSKGTVDLTIYGLTGEDTDLYRCQVEFFYPPPYISIIGNGTLVYIQESPDCPTERTEARVQDIPEPTPIQSPSLHITLLSAVLITTTITLILQVRKYCSCLFKVLDCSNIHSFAYFTYSVHMGIPPSMMIHWKC